MPGTKYQSIQNPRQYRALRRAGYSKESAARISNGRTPGHTVKATRITGNLFRGEGGRFQAGTGGETAKPQEKPTVEQSLEAKPDTKPDRAAEHDQWQAEEDARRQAEDDQIASEPNARKRTAMRRQVTAARQKRSMEQRARERENRATDRAQRETDRTARTLAKDQERAAREQAKLDAAANKPKKSGGGGGGGSAKPAKPTDDEKRAANLQKRSETAQATAKLLNLPDGTVNTLVAARDQGGVADKRLEAMGLIGPDGFTTDQGRRALGALQRGDVGGYHAAIQDARARLQREATARQRQAERDARQAERDAAKNKPDPQERTDAPVAGARARGDRFGQLITRTSRRRRAVERQPITKAFRTYKDATGVEHWACITTSAYEDRDQEIITRKGLAYATTYGQATGNLGTLNYWHTPLILGDCTFQALSDDGMFLIEAGTFRSKAAAELGKRLTAKGWRMSPGFLRPATEPYRAVIKGRVVGLYDHPHIFERSPCPPNRASNLYSPFIAKEATMTEEQYRVLKAIAPDLADTLLGQVQTQKAAAEQAGAVFKSTPDPTPQPESLPIYELDGSLYTTKEGRLVALKAMAPAIGTAKADMPPPEMVEAGATEMDDGMADEGLETESGLTLSDADIAAVAQAVIGLITPMFDIQKQIGELKSALGGVMSGTPATKQIQQQIPPGWQGQIPAALQVAPPQPQAVIPAPQPAAPPAIVEKQASTPDFNALLANLAALTETVKQIKGDQPEAAYSRPSQASDTVVQADNPLLAGYKSVTDNPQGVVDSFLGGFPFPAFQQNGIKR